MNLRKLLMMFLESKRASGRADSTISSYRYHIEHFERWATANGYIESDLLGLVGAETFEDYLQFRRAHGLSEHTILDDYRNIKSFYSWLAMRKVLPGENPFMYLEQPPKPDTLPKAIPEDQYLILLNYLHQLDGWTARRDEMIFSTLGGCGVRAGELLALKIEDVDLTNRLLKIYSTKTRTERFVPMPKSTADLFQSWLDQHRPEGSQYLWPTSDGWNVSGNPLQSHGLREICKRRCKAANLPKIWFTHSFRHRVGREIIKRGGNLRIVADQLGHRQIETSARYAKYRTDELVQQIDRLFD